MAAPGVVGVLDLFLPSTNLLDPSWIDCETSWTRRPFGREGSCPGLALSNLVPWPSAILIEVAASPG